MEQKLIATIRNKIINLSAKSAWDKGVRTYAEEIFNNYIEDLDNDSNKQITEKDLLNGAEDWQRYSEGGFSLIFDTDICKRLCSPSEQKKTQNGKRKPNSKEDWIDVQARALQQAAAIILSATNKSQTNHKQRQAYPECHCANSKKFVLPEAYKCYIMKEIRKEVLLCQQ